MSLARLFVSGLLVAGGLILGAFTLHGYLDPQWAQRQALAASAEAQGTPGGQHVSGPQPFCCLARRAGERQHQALGRNGQPRHREGVRHQAGRQSACKEETG